MIKKITVLFFCLSFVLTLTACQVNNKGNQTNDKPQIVTTFYPLWYLAEQIAGDNAQTTNLANTRDVHEYEPSPQDLALIQNADLFIYQSQYLETWVRDLLPDLEANGTQVLEILNHLDLTSFDGAPSSNEQTTTDPHTWLDPILAQSMTDEIAKTIKSIDVEHSTIYDQNAQNLIARFRKLNQDFKIGLSTCRDKRAIISHDAFGYLAKRYDFTLYPIAGLSTADQPSAQTLAELKQLADQGVSYILVEESNITSFADTLAAETGLRMLNINPLGRGTLDPDKDFFDVMYDNLGALQRAFLYD